MKIETYIILRDFIKTAGYTNKDFAKLAHIPPSTFQSILDRKSERGIKTDMLGKILDAMSKLETCTKDEEQRNKLHKSFHSFVNSITVLGEQGATYMDYRAIMPQPHETIAQALRSCHRNNCDTCPYAIESTGCANLATAAADLLEKQAAEIKKLKGSVNK